MWILCPWNPETVIEVKLQLFADFFYQKIVKLPSKSLSRKTKEVIISMGYGLYMLKSTSIPNDRHFSYALRSLLRCWYHVTSFATVSAKFDFVRSGNVNRNNGSARNLGINGYNWSTTASPVYNNGSAALTGYNLNFNASGVNPSDGPLNRWLGFPIRCLAY